jgi:hypothetical protein
MVWFYSRGADKRSCETRLALDGQGYELIVTDADGVHVERFDELSNLLAREHELLAAWRAQGWREASAQPGPQ